MQHDPDQLWQAVKAFLLVGTIATAATVLIWLVIR